MSFNRWDVGFLFLIFLNVSLSYKTDFDACTRYTSFGYNYRDFFEFHEKNPSSEYNFFFEFYVKTTSDAHILLKSDLKAKDSIEIVIGGGANSFSQIREERNGEKKTIVTEPTHNILSDFVHTHFQISIDKSGIVLVEDEGELILSWRFDHLFPVKYFALGSWSNIKADWRFECTEDEVVIKADNQLTPLEKLKNDLLQRYNPNTLPSDLSNLFEIKAKFDILNADLNEQRGELKLHGHSVLTWQDKKLKWKPEDYNGIDHMYLPPFQIWTPSLRVLNAIDNIASTILDLMAAGIMVTNNGSIFWRPPFRTSSSCEVDLVNWPNDSHNCSVLIGFWMQPPNLRLAMIDDFKAAKAKQGSKWHIMDFTSLNGLLGDGSGSYGILFLELKRNKDSQTNLLTAPYIVSEILSLSSFWLPLNNPVKFYLSCGSLIMLILTLLSVGQTIPAMTGDIPRLVSIYAWSVSVACFPILIFVFLKNIPTNLNLPRSIKHAVNYSALDRILCLPDLPQHVNMNEDTNTSDSDRIASIRFLTALERCFFFLYICILFLCYILL